MKTHANAIETLKKQHIADKMKHSFEDRNNNNKALTVTTTCQVSSSSSSCLLPTAVATQRLFHNFVYLD